MSTPAELDPRRLVRLLIETLQEINRRYEEMSHGSLERRKEICEQIYNKARDSFQNPAFRTILDEQKKLMLLSLEFRVQREQILEKIRIEGGDPQLIKRLDEVERELRRLQGQMDEKIDDI